MTGPIVHHPTTLTVGPLTLTGFGIAVLAAFVIAHLVTEHELRRRGHDPRPVSDLLFAALIGTLVGAKLYHVVIITHDWHDIFDRSGFVFWGGFAGACAAVWLVIHHKKLSFARIADVAGIALAAGYAVGRTGCWAVGDDYGKPWTGRFAVAFPQGAPPSTTANMVGQFHAQLPIGMNPATVVSVYPTQLMEVALGFAMFLVLWRLRDHRHAEGWLFGVWCVLAGIERFIIEFYRAKDDRFFVFGLSTAQVFALGVAIVGLVAMRARRRVGTGRPDIYGNCIDSTTARRVTGMQR